jgi:hypothetical protein
MQLDVSRSAFDHATWPGIWLVARCASHRQVARGTMDRGPTE